MLRPPPPANQGAARGRPVQRVKICSRQLVNKRKTRPGGEEFAGVKQGAKARVALRDKANGIRRVRLAGRVVLFLRPRPFGARSGRRFSAAWPAARAD